MNKVASRTLFFELLATLLVVNSAVKVTAPSGNYEGNLQQTSSGEELTTFLGIPYAEPPVGELRFKKTVPKEKLDGDYDATEAKPHCIQMDYIQYTGFDVGQEDCLYLNIYRPSVKQGDKLKKVFVFVHGGGNMNGFQDLYNPTSLVTENDIIAVTLNYRLGVLGFLSTSSSSSVGNFGLWDQVMALRWIQENIEAFGGDPKGVTLSGESAGSIDVTVLTISPQGKDLFLRTFAMSGSIGVEHDLTGDPVPTAIMVAQRENCLSDNISTPLSHDEWDTVIECLRGIPAENFAQMEGLVSPVIGPVVDGDFLPDSVHKLFADADYLESIHFHDRDYMFSLCYNEGEIFRAMIDIQRKKVPHKQLEEMDKKNPNAAWHGTISSLLTMLYGPVSQEVVEKVAKFYESAYNPDGLGSIIPLNPVSDFTGDAYFRIPTLEYIEAVAEAILDDSRVHLLHFLHCPDFMAGHFKCLAHVVDLAYLFDMEPGDLNRIVDYKINSSRWTDDDTELRNNYKKIVAEYVKTGKTVLPVKDKELEWPWYENGDGYYLEFSTKPAIARYLKKDRMQFFQKSIPTWIKEFPHVAPVSEKSNTHISDEL